MKTSKSSHNIYLKYGFESLEQFLKHKADKRKRNPNGIFANISTILKKHKDNSKLPTQN